MSEELLRDAIELLDRIYGFKTGGEFLADDGMTVEWIEREIGAFIRKHGLFPELLDRLGPSDEAQP